MSDFENQKERGGSRQGLGATTRGEKIREKTTRDVWMRDWVKRSSNGDTRQGSGAKRQRYGKNKKGMESWKESNKVQICPDGPHIAITQSDCFVNHKMSHLPAVWSCSLKRKCSHNPHIFIFYTTMCFQLGSSLGQDSFLLNTSCTKLVTNCRFVSLLF